MQLKEWTWSCVTLLPKIIMNIYLTHWPLGDLDAILKLQFSISFYWLVSSHRLKIMPWDECYGNSQMMSTLVQVMAWCRQATSHYLSQCWPSSMSPYGVTRPQWVKNKQGKSEGFDSCDWPSNLTQIGLKLSNFQPMWPWNLMDDLEKLKGTYSTLHQALCIISNPSAN